MFSSQAQLDQEILEIKGFPEVLKRTIMLLLVGGALFFALVALAVIGVSEARAGVKRLNRELGLEPKLGFEERGKAPQEPSVRVSSIAA